MAKKPRTWTLLRAATSPHLHWFSYEHDDIGGPVPVIEREPVLDLLERIWRQDKPPYGHREADCPHCQLSAEIEALLREHGRLS